MSAALIPKTAKDSSSQHTQVSVDVYVSISITEYVKHSFGMPMDHDFETREYNRTGLLVYSHFVN